MPSTSRTAASGPTCAADAAERREERRELARRAAASGSPAAAEQRPAAADDVVEEPVAPSASALALARRAARRARRRRAACRARCPAAAAACVADRSRIGGDHGGVAGRGLGRIGDADHPAELHREARSIARTCGDALARVGVEQRIRARAGEHEVELPGEIGGVAEARAHALAGERRHLVRGVAGEQQAARAASRPPSAPGSGRRCAARGAAFSGVTPHGASSRQAVASLLSSSMLSPGRRMNSQRRRPGSAGDQRRRPRRIADLDVERTPAPSARCGRTSTISQSKKKPRSVTVAPSCRRTKLLAPSQPIDVARARRAALAVGRARRRARRRRRPRASADDLAAAVHLDVGQRARARASSSALELGLREHVGLRPAARARRPGCSKRSSVVARRVAPFVDVGRLGQAARARRRRRPPAGCGRPRGRSARRAAADRRPAASRRRRPASRAARAGSPASGRPDRSRRSRRRRSSRHRRVLSACAPAISSARSSGARNDGGTRRSPVVERPSRRPTRRGFHS